MRLDGLIPLGDGQRHHPLAVMAGEGLLYLPER
jgi:hypothetical protein